MTVLRTIVHGALVLAGTLACAGAGAQPADEPPLLPAHEAASDRAQKESERALYWIRVLAEKPAAPKAAERKPAAASPKETRPVNEAAAAAEARPPSRVKPASSAPGATSVAATAAETPLAGRKAGNATAMAAPAGLDARAALPAAGTALAGPAPAATETIAPSGIEEPDPGLVMTRSADPQFPIAAMRRLRKGEVEVRFEVGPDGRVEDASVVKTTSPNLNNAALDAVRQWQFKPTPRGHVAVVDLAFNLDS